MFSENGCNHESEINFEIIMFLRPDVALKSYFLRKVFAHD